MGFMLYLSILKCDSPISILLLEIKHLGCFPVWGKLDYKYGPDWPDMSEGPDWTG